MAPSCKIGLLRHQQRIQNPRRKNPKRVNNKELRRNTRGLEYSRNCAQKSYQKTVQKLLPKNSDKVIIYSKKSSYELLRCGKCDETFKKKFYFDFHLNISQVTSDFEKCKLCHFKSCTIIGLKMHVRKVHAQIHAINSKPSMDKKNASVPEIRPKSVLKAAPKVESKLVTIPEPKLETKPEPELETKPEPKLVTKPEPKLVTKPKSEPKSEQKAVPKSMSKCALKSGQKPISESKLGPNQEQSKKSPETPNENQNLENENKNEARFVLPRPKKGQWIVRVEKLRITRM